MAQLFVDAYGHEVIPTSNNTLTLAAAAAGTSAAGTIIPVNAGLGAGSTITSVTATDRAGSFVATAAGTPAAGKIATVFFKQPYGAIPRCVIVTIGNNTDTTASLTVTANNISAASFDIVSTVATAAKAYLINYVVIP